MKRDINEELFNLTSSPDKLVGKSENEVARILRTVMFEMNITPKVMLDRIDTWMKGGTGGPLSHKPNANDRGNFIKAIIKRRVSFGRFALFMRVMNPLSWSITIGIKTGPREEKKIRFDYCDNPERYMNVLGKEPPMGYTVINTDEED